LLERCSRIATKTIIYETNRLSRKNLAVDFQHFPIAFLYLPGVNTVFKIAVLLSNYIKAFNAVNPNQIVRSHS